MAQQPPSVEDLPKTLTEALAADRSAALDEDMLERLACAYLDEPRVWLQCKDVLKQFKIVREVEGRVKILAREIREIPSIGGAPAVERSVSELWQGAPVTDDVYVPTGYAISDARPAIERIENRMMGDNPYEKRTAVCLDPLLISRRIGHVQTRDLLLEIQFKTTHGWRKAIFERDVMLNSRKIVDTARVGIPVGSDNALELVAWVRHYEQCNRDRLPIGYASSSMGWQGSEDNPTQHGFLCGTRQIGGNGRAIELEGSDGDMANAREIRPRGSYDLWKETVGRLSKFAAVQLGVAASLTPPVISIVEGPNAVIEFAGRTSTGKTTILKVAQSVWRSAGTHLATWNSTIIGVEAAAQFLCDLPLIIDDTSAAIEGGRSQSIGKVIYQLVAGRARGRATRDGSQRISSRWRTIVLASGETPIGEIAKAEGASARVMTFWSAPLGETTPETGALVSESIHALSENYGHAGPAVIEWLCNHRDQWDNIRRLYSETANRVRRSICTPAASRLAEVVALLECGAWVGAQSGCTPWVKGPLLGNPEILELLRGGMTLATSNADRAYDAWEHVISEGHSRPKSWIGWGESPKGDRDPAGGWLGYRNAGEWGWFPQQLRKVLQQGGFTPEAALRAWRDIGLLIAPEKSRYTSQCRPMLDRTKVRLIRVRDSYPGHEMDDEDE